MDASQVVPLNRLLQRLDATLNPSEGLSSLQQSPYERTKFVNNLQHARTLLLTAEKQSSTIRVQSQRQQVQADLQRKREVIKRLNVRLQELEELQEDSSSDDDAENDDSNVPMEFRPARKDIEEGLDTGEPQDSRVSEQQVNELRSRRPLQASDNLTAASTTARESLFAGAKQHPDIETHEALMSHNRTEQEALTNGLLSLATALKQSSLQFSSSLSAEKDVLKRAEGSMEQSEQGMDKATRGMGTLRRMTEGKGWFARLKLWGFVAALWVACFCMVFVMPKLR